MDGVTRPSEARPSEARPREARPAQARHREAQWPTATRPYGARALPLPPDERRLAIVETAIAMIRREHAMPSTRALAQECGIAEGTVFRAFATKEALIEAIASATACPYPLRARMLAIPADLPLRDRMGALTELLTGRFTEIFQILGPLGAMGPPRHGPHPGCPGPPGEPLDPARLRQHIAAVIGPDAQRLRVDIDVLIDALRYLSFAGSHPGISDGRFLTPQVILDLVLDGALRRGEESPDQPAHTRPGADPDAPTRQDCPC